MHPFLTISRGVFVFFAHGARLTSPRLRGPSLPPSASLSAEPPRASMSPRTLSSPALFTALILIVVAVANGQSKTATFTSSLAPTPTPTFVPPTPSMSPTATASFVPGTVSRIYSYTSAGSIIVKSDETFYTTSSVDSYGSTFVSCLVCYSFTSNSCPYICIEALSPSPSLTPSSSLGISPSSTLSATSTPSAMTQSRSASPNNPGYFFTSSAASTPSINVRVLGAFDTLGNAFIVDVGSANRLLYFNVTSATSSTIRTGGFSGAQSMAVDSLANVFLAYTNENCVRVWSTSGQVLTTIVGICGSFGLNFNNTGPGSNIFLSSPVSIAVDTAGNAYIADRGNFCVRKWTKSTGIVSSVVGTCGVSGSFTSGIVGTATSLPEVVAVAVDGAGNLYIGLGSYGQYALKWSASTGIVDNVPGAGSGYGNSGFRISQIAVNNAGNSIYMYQSSFSDIYVLRTAISASPSATSTRSNSPSASQTPTVTVTPYCAPSLYRALPRMDLVGTLVGSAFFPGQGFYTENEAACRQACCDAAACDSFAYALGATSYYIDVAWRSASPSASPSQSASPSPSNVIYFGGSPASGSGAGAAGAPGSGPGLGYGAQCYLFVNVTALVPSNIMSSGVLTSKYS